jgi:hypothetical protein
MCQATVFTCHYNRGSTATPFTRSTGTKAVLFAGFNTQVGEEAPLSEQHIMPWYMDGGRDNTG